MALPVRPSLHTRTCILLGSLYFYFFSNFVVVSSIWTQALARSGPAASWASTAAAVAIRVIQAARTWWFARRQPWPSPFNWASDSEPGQRLTGNRAQVKFSLPHRHGPAVVRPSRSETMTRLTASKLLSLIPCGSNYSEAWVTVNNPWTSKMTPGWARARTGPGDQSQWQQNLRFSTWVSAAQAQVGPDTPGAGVRLRFSSLSSQGRARHAGGCLWLRSLCGFQLET